MKLKSIGQCFCLVVEGDSFIFSVSVGVFVGDMVKLQLFSYFFEEKGIAWNAEAIRFELL